MNYFSALLVFFSFMLIASDEVSANSCEDPKPLRFALIPKTNPEQQLAKYQPLIQQLEKKLARRIEVVPSPSYSTIIEGLLAGTIDLAELGPASYAIALNRGAGISAFASFGLRKGPHTDSESAYRSLLLVRRDKGIEKIEQLRGKTLSLTDPASTSGAILPRQAIRQLTDTPLESYFQRVTFAGSHDRAIAAVDKGLVDAAFASSSMLDEALRRKTLQANQLRILWQSPLIPYDPVVLRTKLCPSIAEKIKQTFLNEPAALAGMFQELNITGFVPVTDNNYSEILRLLTTQP
ncbi:phosphate/phosphite/phosphonate ABC transporter substrate-binding protein [Ferribacterium limneticum]|uniref:phosphate/phosphite/phosphonate ABC transporter substrate-binding protein n=1 Tax=Ferribacterium limneticum TaxID=76259 RepID=UPI001CFBE9B2|nr:phosphate/phosphite/phosphonate ABC transporter substrate-binding protein [Ferribacterium limneticum]UCV29376.1 phosphate/phosphite/phosphonate ABC transporter substrate-binding protein [Ferribacterium limneticum]UCV33295.1 phosphate/phosphite/phosphonate ABC transporter substrate-binding protein [Ferribacterium limneticum]